MTWQDTIGMDDLDVPQIRRYTLAKNDSQNVKTYEDSYQKAKHITDFLSHFFKFKNSI